MHAQWARDGAAELVEPSSSRGVPGTAPTRPLPPPDPDLTPAIRVDQPVLKILMLEDTPIEAELIIRRLHKAGLDFTALRVANRAEFVDALETFAPDILLADYRLPDFDGAAALTHVRRNYPQIPVIMVTGALGEEAAIELLHAGAADYVLKSNLVRLPLAVERAISGERGIRARKAAEAALRASNALLRTTERIAHIGGFDWDIASGVILWSEETYRAFGRAPDEFAPTLASFAECIHPDDRARVEAAINASVAHNQPFDIEFRIVCPDRSERIIHSRGEVQRDEHDQPVGMTGTSHDVTERKHNERRIVESEAKFRSLVEQNVAGIFIIRDDGTIGYVNPFFAGVLGYAAAELIGRPLLDFIPEDAKADLQERLSAQLFGDGPFIQQNSHLRAKDGRDLEVLVNASRSIFEDRPASVAIVLDITETNKAQRDLVSTAAILATEHEVSPDGIVVVDPQRSIISANRRFVDMWGIPPEIMATRSEEQAFAWALQNKIADPVAIAPQMAEALTRPDEVRRHEVTLKDGRVYEVHRSPFVRSDGVGRVWFFRDITDRQRAEAELRESEERFRLVVEEAPDAILLYDVDRDRLVAANKVAEQLFGLPRDKLIEHGPQHFYAPEQPDGRPVVKSFGDHNKRALAGEALTYERRIRTAAGAERLCQVTLVHMPSPSQRLLRASFIDITERKEAERALHRLNRTLRTLSRGNEALVRAASERELLDQMCRVIVETGGYQSAWVGVPQQDAEKTVGPVAWAGIAGEFFEGPLRHSWAREAEGGCVCGQALNSNQFQTSQNLLNDLVMARWQTKFARYGIRSTAAFPLSDGATAFAVLVIYAAEADAFDADELKLLQELANDLAFGIRALREHTARESLDKRWRVSLEATIGAIASTVEMRDPYTAGHQQRVAKLAVAIARELGLPVEQIEGLYLAGIVHDVGKIDIPAEILNKPGKLSKLQYQLIQAHAEAGYDIVKGVDFPWPIAEMVRQHHERLDGSGYPHALKAEAILPEAKILAVADVVEAMMSHRPYRATLGLAAALAEIEAGKDKFYDPAAVAACTRLFRENRFNFE